MKVLFVSSGNSTQGISPIVYSQGESLSKHGADINVEYFTIKGKGIRGYYRSISKLRKYLRNNSFDIIHAHYSLSGFVASFAGVKPLVVSLMGSDVKAAKWFKWLILFFKHFFWKKTIVKSDDMKNSLGFRGIEVIPNGVNIDLFRPMNQKECQKSLDWDSTKKHILFPSNPKRPEKNYQLFEEAMSMLNSSEIVFHTLVNVPHFEVPLYLNAADVVGLTSLWEGSPNAIKEAMACNIPIVSTNVGDVKWLLKNVKGCYIAPFEASEYSLLIVKALEYGANNKSTFGIKRVEELSLTSKSVAMNLISIYKEVI